MAIESTALSVGNKRAVDNHLFTIGSERSLSSLLDMQG